MPKIRNLARLFSAIAQGDLQSAEAIAVAIATDEEKTGHHSAAQTLRGALHPNGVRTRHDTEQLTLVLPQDALINSALTHRTDGTKLTDVMLSATHRKQLESIITEVRHAPYLEAKGIRRRSKLLFVGPPGCGKSFTAQALANELKFPLYVVRFDAVIGAYLGQTAIHLRQLFSFASDVPCVLLFDEIDALGKQRGNPLDVGELDRIVIALMQELELLRTRGIIIATSNLPQNLDRALWRRFDIAVRFPPPTRRDVMRYARILTKRFQLVLSRRCISELSKARSYAEAETIVEAEARRLALAKL